MQRIRLIPTPLAERPFPKRLAAISSQANHPARASARSAAKISPMRKISPMPEYARGIGPTPPASSRRDERDKMSYRCGIVEGGPPLLPSLVLAAAGFSRDLSQARVELSTTSSRERIRSSSSCGVTRQYRSYLYYRAPLSRANGIADAAGGNSARLITLILSLRLLGPRASRSAVYCVSIATVRARVPALICVPEIPANPRESGSPRKRHATTYSLDRGAPSRRAAPRRVASLRAWTISLLAEGGVADST